MEEIFALANKEVKKNHFADLLGGGVVLTGGTLADAGRGRTGRAGVRDAGAARRSRAGSPASSENVRDPRSLDRAWGWSCTRRCSEGGETDARSAPKQASFALPQGRSATAWFTDLFSESDCATIHQETRGRPPDAARHKETCRTCSNSKLDIDSTSRPSSRSIGVGGAGGNAVNRMIGAGPARRGVHRRQHRHPGAHQSLAPTRSCRSAARDHAGLGSGGDPDDRPARRRGGRAGDRRRARRRRHGVHHRRHGRRHRHRRGAGRGAASRARRARSPSPWSRSRSTSRAAAACARPTTASPSCAPRSTR